MLINPLNWDYQVWRFFFLISAIWNFMGIFGVIWPRQSFMGFFGQDTEDQITIGIYRLLWTNVLLFGIGYLIVAYDPGSNLGLILLGIIGKVIASAGFIVLYRQGVSTKGALFGAAGDMLFTLFFILYLIGGSREPLPI